MIIKNVRYLNPATGEDLSGVDIVIENGVVKAVGENAGGSAAHRDGQEIVDARGACVLPGFIDLHVHFRDPGQTQKEDILTGSAAAARGGFTTVCAMPNTSPVADGPEIIRYVQDKAKEAGLCRVYQVGSITKGMRGKELSDIRGMKDAGCIALSEDGKSVMDSGLMLDAMKLAAELDLPILDHCEDAALVRGGVVNAAAAGRLGIPGISNAVENIIAVRDVMLAAETGARLHLCHNSTAESYDLLREAKARAMKVSGEVCPHHFTLCDRDILSADEANYKMNPPLRTQGDVQALKNGLRDGVFEVIATDHAPHTREEKSRGFLKAPFGIVGLETAAALACTELVKPGLITLLQMAERMSLGPARVLGLERGDISVGKAADLVVFDPEASYEIHAADFAGKATNMPYEGRKVCGKVLYTIMEGRVTYDSKAH